MTLAEQRAVFAAVAPSVRRLRKGPGCPRKSLAIGAKLASFRPKRMCRYRSVFSSGLPLRVSRYQAAQSSVVSTPRLMRCGGRRTPRWESQFRPSICGDWHRWLPVRLSHTTAEQSEELRFGTRLLGRKNMFCDPRNDPGDWPGNDPRERIASPCCARG